jgi:hypothetical protein
MIYYSEERSDGYRARASEGEAVFGFMEKEIIGAKPDDRRTRLDAIARTQTEIKLAYRGFILAWFCFLFMVHEMNLPHRSVSSWVLVAFVFAAVCAAAAGFVMRKKLFALSTESLPGDPSKVLRLWRGAHFISFSNAMSLTILGVALRFLGTSWLVPGVLFGLSLGFLLLWRPRQMAANSAQPA